ncbi:hypothetical protein CAEBREN_23242 [Caenorhabditis brenneri]|uniref:Uncharacterized protein n=1 Tax=Caenorhabditis brenneri TaxID=135651 RepID=G0PKX5_CAEBE|nr:hypothetical protein CAEBREN_23242 [Caenorhabditis brenneri]
MPEPVSFNKSMQATDKSIESYLLRSSNVNDISTHKSRQEAGSDDEKEDEAMEFRIIRSLLKTQGLHQVVLNQYIESNFPISPDEAKTLAAKVRTFVKDLITDGHEGVTMPNKSKLLHIIGIKVTPKMLEKMSNHIVLDEDGYVKRLRFPDGQLVDVKHMSTQFLNAKKVPFKSTTDYDMSNNQNETVLEGLGISDNRVIGLECSNLSIAKIIDSNECLVQLENFHPIPVDLSEMPEPVSFNKSMQATDKSIESYLLRSSNVNDSPNHKSRLVAGSDDEEGPQSENSIMEGQYLNCSQKTLEKKKQKDLIKELVEFHKIMVIEKVPLIIELHTKKQNSDYWNFKIHPDKYLSTMDSLFIMLHHAAMCCQAGERDSVCPLEFLQQKLEQILCKNGMTMNKAGKKLWIEQKEKVKSYPFIKKSSLSFITAFLLDLI